MKITSILLFAIVLATCHTSSVEKKKATPAPPTPPTVTVLKARWTPNEEMVDGYKILIGKATRSYDWRLDLGSRTACGMILPNGHYFMAVSAYKGSLQGGPSNEVEVTVP
jgi:hypothetical protein